MHDLTAQQLVDQLGLSPHPEGGWFREMWRHRHEAGERDHATSILFLLAAGDRSHWHTVDAAELWVHQGGAPLELLIHQPGGPIERHVIGHDPEHEELVLQRVVPPHAWQSARSLGAWSLVGCVVVPAFEFAGFVLADAGWEPQAG